MIRKLFFTLLSIVCVTGVMAQTPIFTVQQNMAPRRIDPDSGLQVPVLNTNRTFVTNRDSIGQLWMRTDSAKLFARFPGNIVRALAREDSIRALRAAINSYAFNLPTLSSVLSAGNTSDRVINLTSGTLNVANGLNLFNSSEDIVLQKRASGSAVSELRLAGNGSILLNTGPTATNNALTLTSNSATFTGVIVNSAAPSYSTGGYVALGVNATTGQYQRVPILDSITALRSSISAIPPLNLQNVLTGGNTTNQNVFFGDTNNIRFQKNTDYAVIKFRNRISADSSVSALEFITGDNPREREGFRFLIDTGKTVGATQQLDTLMIMHDEFTEFKKPIFSRMLINTFNGLLIQKEGANTVPLTVLRILNGAGTAGANIQLTASDGGNGLSFWLGAVGSFSERMRLTADGRLGIGLGSNNATSNFQVSGSVSHGIPTVITSTTTLGDIYRYHVNNSSNIVINLPAASTCPGRIYAVKKISNNGNTITFTPASGTIETAATYVMSAYLGTRIVYNDGTNWWVE